MAQSRNLLGPALVVLFCLSQAFRDVYFGNVFQGVDFFAVILLAFVASTVIFTAIALLRDRSQSCAVRSATCWRRMSPLRSPGFAISSA
jgi:hypothetical protein